MWYIDSSAQVKLVVRERESEELVKFVQAQDGSIITSDLGSVEMMRLGHRHEVPELASALDAIHIACAASTPSVRGIVTYDARMVDAASTLGIAVVSPS